MARDLERVREALREAGPLEPPALIDAVATACLLMAAADGHIAPAETRRIAEVLIALSGTVEDREAVESALQERAVEVATGDQEHHVRELAERVREPQQRRKVLAYAAAVAWADHRLDIEEEVLLEQLAEAFEVEREELARLVGLLKGT
jgi:tellurite resistance protein